MFIKLCGFGYDYDFLTFASVKFKK
jgi:hypothetical protein